MPHALCHVPYSYLWSYLSREVFANVNSSLPRWPEALQTFPAFPAGAGVRPVSRHSGAQDRVERDASTGLFVSTSSPLRPPPLSWAALGAPHCSPPALLDGVTCFMTAHVNKSPWSVRAPIFLLSTPCKISRVPSPRIRLLLHSLAGTLRLKLLRLSEQQGARKRSERMCRPEERCGVWSRSS